MLQLLGDCVPQTPAGASPLENGDFRLPESLICPPPPTPPLDPPVGPGADGKNSTK